MSPFPKRKRSGERGVSSKAERVVLAEKCICVSARVLRSAAEVATTTTCVNRAKFQMQTRLATAIQAGSAPPFSLFGVKSRISGGRRKFRCCCRFRFQRENVLSPKKLRSGKKFVVALKVPGTGGGKARRVNSIRPNILRDCHKNNLHLLPGH